MAMVIKLSLWMMTIMEAMGNKGGISVRLSSCTTMGITINCLIPAPTILELHYLIILIVLLIIIVIWGQTTTMQMVQMGLTG